MISIAIDGPSGAGKSTVAKQLAKKLSYIYVDTGAMYRTIGFYAINNGVDTTDPKAMSNILTDINLEILYTQENGQRIYLNGEDVSDDIRSPEMSQGASEVSVHRCVREHLLSQQRECGSKNNIVMDGRDIGTVVLPNATYKIYLTASEEGRAKRRYEDYLKQGMKIEYKDVLQQVIDRDNRDMNREVAPLKKAEDAVFVDNTNDTLEETVSKILKIINERV